MRADFPMRGRATRLLGRRAECGVLDRLVEAVRAGESRALVVHGEPGVGKTVLLEYLAGQAPDCRVASAAGVQSEMELAFAALHQLCTPMLDRLEILPVPQRDALRTAFGMSPGPVPDRFLVGLGVLGLLSEAAAERPLVCLVDDEQWLDRASAQVLAFVARRLGAESVGLVFGARVPTGDLAGLPELVIGGLRDADARALLDSALTGPLDARVRDQAVAETRGNPLALVELPRGLTPAELAGGFGLPGALPLSVSVEESFRRRGDALPAGTRLLLLLAAAEPAGDAVLVWRAAGRLGIGAAAAWPAAEADLAEFGARVRFRHPLVRSAVYRAASVSDRQEAHGALAEATDPELDPDRRAWHRAQAVPGPDEDVAADLERSAGRAQARGGLAAAAAFLDRAVALTPDPARRAQRALAAAEAKQQAGAFDAALDLLASAELGPLDELGRARVDLLRAQIAYASKHGSDAPPLLLRAAKRLEEIDPGLACGTYLDAFFAAMTTGRLTPRDAVLEVAEAARAAPPPARSLRPPDLLLYGLAALITDGYAAGAPMLKQALREFRDQELAVEEGLRWLPLACKMAHDVWDDDSWYVLSSRLIDLARDAGALTVLPIGLSLRFAIELFAGKFASAESLSEEKEAVSEATRSDLAPYGTLLLAAWRGREEETVRLIEAATREIVLRGEGQWLTASNWAAAVLYNGLGRFEEARVAAEQAREYPHELGLSNWALTELVEAAARSGKPARAGESIQRLSEMASATGTDWALGNAACARALVSQGEAAESFYREAIARLGRTRIRVQLARAHLLYGEWLRLERRRADAREELRTAHGMLEAMGLEAFAERARRELRAAGETARQRTITTREELTAQEAQIARLAREGLSNPEIATRLFISARTVQYHLGKVFTKLSISSRGQLGRVLPSN